MQMVAPGRTFGLEQEQVTSYITDRVHRSMEEAMRQPVDRRTFVLGAAAAAAVVPFTAATAQDNPLAWQEALKKIIGDAKPIEGKVLLELPEIAENGNTVPFSVSVDSPMTEKEYVKAIHVLATANPQPGVATFRLTATSGKAAVSSRMRLARTQEIVCVAEISNGKFLTAKRIVKVTIGGCGG
jgi:sulfur-oxidizing protein SoxY